MLKGTPLRTTVLLCGMLAMLSGCNPSNKAIPAGIDALPPSSANVGRIPAVAEYRIGPLDELSVRVFNEPELSSERVVVDVAGKINLPIVGQLPATGRTVDELDNEITAILNQRYLKYADVTVTITRPTSYTFTVEGEIKKPGVYPIPGTVTLLQAVAIGEGLTENARTDDIFVFRTVDQQRYAAKFNLKDIRLARADDPMLRAGDVVVVGYSTSNRLYRDIIAALPGLGTIFFALTQN